MGRTVTFSQKVEGLSELLERLETAPLAAGKKIMRTGLKEAAGIWREEMKNRVARGFHVWESGQRKFKGQKILGRSREFGALSKLIGMKTSVRGDELAGTCSVGPVRIGFWSLFLEFGTHSGAGGRGIPPQPFIRVSYESRGNDVAEKFAEVVKRELDAAGIGGA